ncbi:substrate-binding periplasmic protein [Jatrophihabitans sp. DSM 45814]
MTSLALVLAGCSSSGDKASGGSSASASGGSASASKANFSLTSNGTLTVAVYGSNPPYLTIEPDGSLGGVDGTLINGFAQSQGLKVTPYKTTFASSILAVEQKKADMATYLFYTADRSKKMYYTLPFLGDTVVMFTQSSFDWSGPDSMKGHTVAAVAGEVWAPYLQKASGIKVKLYPDDPSAATAFLNHQTDGLVNGTAAAVIPPLQGKTGFAVHPLVAGDYGLPANTITNVSYNTVACDNKSLAQAYDDYVQKYADSGQLKTMTAQEVAKAVGTGSATLPNLAPELKLPAQGC